MTAFAQTNAIDSLPVYKRFPDVPPFTITRVPDSTQFSKADLHKNQNTIVMVFSPDCEHCQHATEDMLSHFNLFKKVQIVMATPLEYRFIVPFYYKYQISKYPNITIGRDPTYFLGQFYSVHNYPAIFLYNKKGKFVKSFEGSVPFTKIASYLK